MSIVTAPEKETALILESDGLRQECVMLRSMLFQYTQLLLEARGSALSAPGSAAEVRDAKALKSKLEVLRQAMGATTVALPPTPTAGLILAPTPKFALSQHQHQFPSPEPLAPTTPATASAAQQQLTVSGAAAGTTGHVQKELARLRLRDGILQQHLAEARAAEEEARAAAARQAEAVTKVARQYEEMEAALGSMRRELGQALHSLARQRRASEVATGQADEWRRQQQVSHPFASRVCETVLA